MRIVFEIWLGYRSIDLIQPRLWVFFGLISAEYLFQIKNVLYGRFYIDKSMYASGLLLIMTIHGFLIGIGWHNKPEKIATDTIPVVVAAVNIILACQLDAYRNLNFDRVEKLNMAFAIIMIPVCIIVTHSGRPLIANLGGALSTTVSIAIFSVSIWRRKRFSVAFVLCNIAIFILLAPNINRTTLVLFAIISFILFFVTFVVSPFRLYLLFLLIGGFVISAPLIIPPDSPLARRLQGLSSPNQIQEGLSSPNQIQEGIGSIGEREEESHTIDKIISQHGRFAEIFGLGHGAVYRMVFTTGYAPPNYSNAHYGWALFKLRYGYCGYFYLFMFAILITANIYRNIQCRDNFNRMVLIICIGSIIYIFTYMIFNIVLSGMQFMHNRSGPAKPAARGIDAQIGAMIAPYGSPVER